MSLLALASLAWQLQVPACEGSVTHLSPTAGMWLEELSEMRGHVLYDEGRRPTFRLADGKFADPDPLDTYAYHVLLRSLGSIVGCLRLVPLTSTPTCIIESFLGNQELARLLLELNTTPTQTAEISRWMVIPEYRGKNRLALRLVAGVLAIARWLELKTLVAMVGTRDGQDRLVMHMGWQAMPGQALLAAPTFDDELRILYFDLSRPPKSMARLMDEMTVLLRLQPMTDYQHQVAC